jgi:hypothetical protein
VLSMALDFASKLPEKIIKEHRAAYIYKFLNPLNASA